MHVPYRISATGCGAAVALALVAAPAAADSGWEWTWRNTLSAGASWRTEARDERLIGKASLDPQLCAADDCIGTRSDDTTANQRFLAAPGSLSSNTDDGSLNFDQGDIVAAAGKWSSALELSRGPWRMRASALAFYDPVNADFRDVHPNRLVAPGPQPGVAVRTPRGDEAIRAIGRDLQWREGWVRYDGTAADTLPLSLSIGRQTLAWGGSAFATQGTLNVVNPLDSNALTRPGARLSETLLPVGQAIVEIGPNAAGWSLEGFYQFEWRPYGLPARGSLQSFFDAGNEPDTGDHVVALFAKAPNDPEQLGTPAQPLLAAISATSYSLLRAPNREPPGTNQFGVALYRNFGDAISGEFGLFAARYHSRIPVLSVYAAQASCTRREGNAQRRDTASGLQFLADCGIPFVQQPGRDFEALPVDSARWFLEYPEAVSLFGMALHAERDGWIVQAEAAYRPNHPVQVDMEDVMFAAVQPAFPRADLDLSSLLPGLGTGAWVLPSGRRAAPDYVSAYRGEVPGEIAPGAYIRGYERQRTVNTMLGLTRVLGLGADIPLALIGELHAVWLPQRPDLQRLQFEGPGTHTHASAGVADSGDGLRLNPVTSGGGYVSASAWGYRLALTAELHDVAGSGIILRPFVFFAHDVSGVGPGLAENFLPGRRITTAALRLERAAWKLDLVQLWHGGGGVHNPLRDRDQFTAAISMEF